MSLSILWINTFGYGWFTEYSCIFCCMPFSLLRLCAARLTLLAFLPLHCGMHATLPARCTHAAPRTRHGICTYAHFARHFASVPPFTLPAFATHLHAPPRALFVFILLWCIFPYVRERMTVVVVVMEGVRVLPHFLFAPFFLSDCWFLPCSLPTYSPFYLSYHLCAHAEEEEKKTDSAYAGVHFHMPPTTTTATHACPTSFTALLLLH